MSQMNVAKVIIIGGGLAGLSAAHTVLEHGGNVLLVDKNSFLGGNSTKATSGINGAGTKTQRLLKIADSPEVFYDDTARSARKGLRPGLVKVLTHESGPAVEWLQTNFNLDLSLVGRLGGATFPRTHRGKERFPGMTITYALMEKFEDYTRNQPNRAKLLIKSKVTRLLTDDNSSTVIGVEYERDGKTSQEFGPVIIATGGYGADFTENSILRHYRPDICNLATTNGDHCTGDGIKMATAIGGNTCDMKNVQVHPTGLVDPAEPEAKVKFLAAEALRGVGGILLTAEGKRFCDELGHRDYVTGEMWKNKGPFRLVLNSAASKEIEWHCKHYCGRGLMKKYASGSDLAKELGINVDVLRKTFADYNGFAQNKNDPYGKKFFHNLPLSVDDEFHVAIVTPVVHYCMGGLEVDPDSAVLGAPGSKLEGKAIPGLWAAGEVAGGVHGENRLGGSSLLDCVVFGRVSGVNATRFLLQGLLGGSGGRVQSAAGRVANLAGQLGIGANSARIEIDPSTRRVTVDVNFGGDSNGSSSSSYYSSPSSSSASSSTPSSSSASSSASSSSGSNSESAQGSSAGGAASGGEKKVYGWGDVAKHNTEKDCWVVVNGEVLNVTHFLKDHPGGKKAILIYAGRDATEEFNMLHKPDVVQKYAPDSIIGTIDKNSAPAAGAAHGKK